MSLIYLVRMWKTINSVPKINLYKVILIKETTGAFDGAPTHDSRGPYVKNIS